MYFIIFMTILLAYVLGYMSAREYVAKVINKLHNEVKSGECKRFGYWLSADDIFCDIKRLLYIKDK